MKNQITINVYKISTEPMIINMNIIIQNIVCIIYVQVRRNLSNAGGNHSLDRFPPRFLFFAREICGKYIEFVIFNSGKWSFVSQSHYCEIERSLWRGTLQFQQYVFRLMKQWVHHANFQLRLLRMINLNYVLFFS